jgi:hypothetical protein
MSFVDDVQLEIINLLDLNDIMSLYLTSKYHFNLISKIPALQKTLKVLKNLSDNEEDLIIFIGNKLLNDPIIATKLIHYINLYYKNYYSLKYINFIEETFLYLVGNDFIAKSNVNQFISIFNNALDLIYNYLYTLLYIEQEIEIFFDKLKLFNNIHHLDIKNLIKRFWLDYKNSIKNHLHPLGFMGKPYDKHYYKKLEKQYNKFNQMYK